MRFFLFLALIIAVLIIVFTAQNQTEISLKFINWELSGPLPLMLAVPFLVGTVAGLVLVVPVWMKKAKTVKMHKRRIHELEEKLSNISEEVKSEEHEEEPVENDDSRKRLFHSSPGDELI